MIQVSMTDLNPPNHPDLPNFKFLPCSILINSDVNIGLFKFSWRFIICRIENQNGSHLICFSSSI